MSIEREDELGELPEDVQALIEAERDWPPPDGAVLDRIRAGVEERIGGGGPGGQGPSGGDSGGGDSSGGAVATAASRMATLVRSATFAVGVVAGVAGHVAWVAWTAPASGPTEAGAVDAATRTNEAASPGEVEVSPANRPQPNTFPGGGVPPGGGVSERGAGHGAAETSADAEPGESDTPLRARPAATGAAAPSPSPPAAADADGAERAPAGIAATETRRPAAPPGAPPPTAADPAAEAPTAVTDQALERERVLVDRARLALGVGRYADALDACEAHRGLAAEGILTQERMAIEAQALARSGRRAEAERAAERFTARYPSSLYRRAIERALARPDAGGAPSSR